MYSAVMDHRDLRPVMTGMKVINIRYLGAIA